MPYYATSQEWIRQSQLLLEARPTTTRITTKYSLKVPQMRKPKTASSSKPALTPAAAESTAATSSSKPARGSLILKTYDPVSGVTLKYKTSKAAEVSRLIQSLGKLSRPMAGLPELKDEVMTDAPVPAEGGGSGAGTPAVEKSEAAAVGQKPQGAPAQAGGASGGKGKKKKGKK
ncbi:signal recognition particle 9 kDa protein-domain-containing protein [Pseudomassariella vexata]|uniref:Signal recognition particle 9 kDa protein-domain-containing protein n=1 Tax=Pseudomassariella vexata TaxID=1141098 RepID=A0A1Y2EDC1_9PEZI|nr:signal recognition particle 9 kDa protein-domain-containing protein [Pseudomassariella vexata]ORY69560.1 signal recognition particle 9 kDa protein-domain-containing protein [Pseudomassariella vexata]